MSEPAPEPLDENLILPVMLALYDCLCPELEKTVAGPPCFCGIVPGQNVAADYCDCQGGGGCGKAYINLVSVYPSNQFPQPLREPGNCGGTKLAARLRVGVFRCMPVVANPKAFGNKAAEPPTVIQQLTAAREQLSDMQHIRKAIQCCAAASSSRKWMLDAYTPFGPQGGCGGGEWTLWVSV